MFRVFIIPAALTLTLAWPLNSSAQVVPNVGDRVRVRADGTSFIGTLLDVSADSIRIGIGSAEGPPRGLALGSVDRLDVSLGEQRHFGRNFLIAFASLTAFTSVTIGMTWDRPAEPGCIYNCPRSRGEAYAGGALVGAILGLPAGILFGLNRSEAWEPAALPSIRGARLHISPLLGEGLGVHISAKAR